jgi:hypothetical protein
MTWLFLYQRAAELSAESSREADRVRLASQAKRLSRPTVLARGRRAGALAAAAIARRLDECVAHDAVDRWAVQGPQNHLETGGR